jgi:[ribosomal protein S5]-alanine N-acetyltransferase
MTIAAGSVQLRPVEERDAERVAAMMTPAISRWVLSWPARLTRAEAAERIARVRADADAGHGRYYVIERLPDVIVVGWISITRSRDDPRRGALGYWLGAAYHGHGYMTAAAHAVLRVAFDELGLEVVEAGANTENDRSFAIMRRLGMKPAGDRRLWSASRECLEVCRFYELSRTDYEAAASKEVGSP